MQLASLYLDIGGEKTLLELVSRFYHLMDTLPEARTIRALHPKNLTKSEEKLFMFLSGWSGGPPLYSERYGHPRLRARHLPFPISTEERDQWLLCMNLALDEVIDSPDISARLKKQFYDLADFMRNQD